MLLFYASIPAVLDFNSSSLVILLITWVAQVQTVENKDLYGEKWFNFIKFSLLFLYL